MHYYKYKTLETYHIYKLSEDAELNVKDFIESTGSDDPVPVDNVWLPPDSYYLYNQDVHNIPTLTVGIISKLYYKPENINSANTAFLPAQKGYTFVSGKLRIRIKKEVDKIAMFSAFLSLLAILFSYVTYKDQVTELNSSKSPVWISKYDPEDNSISFKSPSSDIQLQKGYVEFQESRKIQSQYLFMPEMKVYMNNFNQYIADHMINAPRSKETIVFGANKIFEPIAIGTKYTYKGEVRYISAIYNIFFDTVIPSIDDKKAKPKTIIKGAEFVRFIEPGIGLQAALDHHFKHEPTDEVAWINLVNGTE